MYFLMISVACHVVILYWSNLGPRPFYDDEEIGTEIGHAG